MTTDTPEKIGLTGDDLLRLEGQYLDKRLELIDGELRIYPPHFWQHAETCSKIAFLLAQYQFQHKTGMSLAGATGFYTRDSDNTVRMADIAFITQERIPEKIPSGYGRIPPDLVVEIVSPGDEANEIEEKIQEWLNFGVRLVWVVYPKTRRVYVYQSDSPVLMLKAEDEIIGGDVLPGFTAKVIQFFQA